MAKNLIKEIRGPFLANEQIYIKDHNGANAIAFKIAIISKPGNCVFINNKEVQIANTGLFELRDTEVSKIAFKQDESEKTTITYMINIGK